MMKVVELFAGTCSFSNVAKQRGHEVWTTDNNPEFDVDLVCDVRQLDYEGQNYCDNPTADVMWCSPPCTYFSVASIGKHWNVDNTPKSKEALVGLDILDHTISIIANELNENNNMIWFIENPRGKMRKMIDKIFKKYGITKYERKTVTYCQYGDTRMKPTDIWTNLIEWTPRKMCKNGDSCHESAPRGSKTGTQGLKGNKERSVVPIELCKEIIMKCEQTAYRDGLEK